MSVHLFQIKDKKIVLDVESDTLHLLDPVSWDVISLMSKGYNESYIITKLGHKYSQSEIDETLKEIEILQSKGLLFSQQQNFNNPKEPLVKALCLNVSHSCNLSCRYCFAGEGAYGGEEALMSPETGMAAIDFLIRESAGRKHLEIDYFGGEPLLNMDVVKEVTAYAREKAKVNGKIFKFTLTTNGLLLNDELIEYLKKEEFSIVLSLDGRQESHDRMRIFKNGGGSYGKVVENLKRFISQWNDNYYIRGTFTRYNLDFSRDAAHMIELGFKHISLEPAVSSLEAPWSFSGEDVPLIEEEYEKLAEHYLEKKKSGEPYTFFHFEIDIHKGPCVYKRLSGCGAGDEYLAVTPTGDIYPCHQLIGEDSLKMGNVKDVAFFKRLPPESFPPSGPLKNECPDCWARYHCGGGCRAASKLINKDFGKPYKMECVMQKKRLECALYIQAELAGK